MKKENKSLYPFIGKEIKNIRRFSNITQEELSNISGVNKDTIRKIENGYTDANVVTLMLLLESLKIDINDFSKIFSNSKGSTINNIQTIYNSIEESLLVYDYKKIQKLLNKVSEIDYSFLPDSTYREVKSKYLLYNSFVDDSLYKNYQKAIETLLYSMEIYSDVFNLKKLGTIKFDDFQARLLMNIGTLFYDTENLDLSHEIFNQLMKYEFYEKETLIQLIYNFANVNLVTGNYKKAMILNNSVNDYLINDLRMQILSIFQRGLILCRLNKYNEGYKCFEKSKILANIYGNKSLNQKLDFIIQKYY